MTRADDAFAVLAGLRNEDGRPWGVAAVELQVADAKAVLADDGPRRHWIGRPRGYSKTADMAGVFLADLITGRIPAAHPAYVGAADRGQAGLVLDSIEGFVARSTLASLVEVQAFRAVHKGSGASIEVLAADGPGVYGIRPSRVLIDELCQWADTRPSRKFLEGLTTALPKVPGSVGIICTTAGTPGHFSHGVYQRALKERALWRVSMTHTPAPWIERKLVEAERRALTDSAFRRLWRNEWTEAEDALVTAADLDAAAVLDGPLPPVLGHTYLVTLDVGLVNDRTVMVVAHRESTDAGTRIVVDQLTRWQGSRRRPVDLDEVTEAIADASKRYGAHVKIDPAKAEHLLQRCRKRGIAISVFNFTTTSVGLLAGSLLRALRSRSILLPKDPVLTEELLSVRIVENSAGVPRLDHDRKGHDDQAVALALAVHALTDGMTHTGPLVHSDEEWAAIQIAERRSMGEPIPEPAPLDAWCSGDTSMVASGIQLTDLDDYLDEDPGEKPNGKTAKSPFL